MFATSVLHGATSTSGPQDVTRTKKRRLAAAPVAVGTSVLLCTEAFPWILPQYGAPGTGRGVRSAGLAGRADGAVRVPALPASRLCLLDLGAPAPPAANPMPPSSHPTALGIKCCVRHVLSRAHPQGC